MDRLGIDQLSVFGLPPVEFVNLAADLECGFISTVLAPAIRGAQAYPPWSLKDDPALRREMCAVMEDRGVTIALGEGLVVLPNADIRDRAADLDIFAELGVPRVATLSYEPDPARSLDQLAALVEMAEARGMETVLEFSINNAYRSLAAAQACVRAVGRPGFKLLIDAMHLVRSGAGPEDLAALPTGAVGYIQLCDVPLVSRFETYLDEAMYERLAPGLGELPLAAILAALPRDLVIGLEIPERARAQAGVGPHERLARCVEAARGLLAGLEG